jgi:hypothetical protein
MLRGGIMISRVGLNTRKNCMHLIQFNQNTHYFFTCIFKANQKMIVYLLNMLQIQKQGMYVTFC